MEYSLEILIEQEHVSTLNEAGKLLCLTMGMLVKGHMHHNVVVYAARMYVLVGLAYARELKVRIAPGSHTTITWSDEFYIGASEHQPIEGAYFASDLEIQRIEFRNNCKLLMDWSKLVCLR